MAFLYMNGGVFLRRQYRLRKPRDFSRVYSKGVSTASRLVVVYALPSQVDSVRVGVAAGKKLGNAVVRNRIKRIIRAALREARPNIKLGYDLVVIGRSGATGVKTQEITKDLYKLFRRLKLLEREPSDV